MNETKEAREERSEKERGPTFCFATRQERGCSQQRKDILKPAIFQSALKFENLFGGNVVWFSWRGVRSIRFRFFFLIFFSRRSLRPSFFLSLSFSLSLFFPMRGSFVVCLFLLFLPVLVVRRSF